MACAWPSARGQTKVTVAFLQQLEGDLNFTLFKPMNVLLHVARPAQGAACKGTQWVGLYTGFTELLEQPQDKHIEVEPLAQGHTASPCKSQNLKSSIKVHM